MNDEDRRAVEQSVAFSELDDESIAVTVLVANLGWDEARAPGRDELTGAWRLSFRDSLPNPEWKVDLPRGSAGDAKAEARRMVAARLAGESDLSGGQPHVSIWR